MFDGLRECVYENWDFVYMALVIILLIFLYAVAIMVGWF